MLVDRTTVLTCLLVILLISITGEYRALRAKYDKPPSLAVPPPPLTPAHSLRLPATDKRAEASIILARPLFNEARRPSPEVGAFTSVTLPRLAGIVVSRDIRTAIFAGGSIGKSIALAEGDPIGAFVVQSIIAGQATMLGPSGPQVLHPTFDANRNDPIAATQMEVNRADQPNFAQVYKGPLLRSTQ